MGKARGERMKRPWYKKELSVLNKYEFFGHFYTLMHEGKPLQDCRSVLEIIKNGYINPRERQELFEKTPDVIIVMMNPGASTPKAHEQGKEDKVDLLCKRENGHKTLLETDPDYTQYRILCLAESTKWKHIRIVNLSDIRESKSKNLPRLLKDFERAVQTTGGEYKDIHSIFSSIRAAELESLLKKEPQTRLIFAWGSKKCLKNYYRLCLTRFAEEEYIGIQSKTNEQIFYHPLATNISWIQQMIEKI
ncbi:hypothetical protein [Anaerospora hongkongensis]|uniref:hypothetical protein n=1 Tax=Anaerospora hongkongensis TaxID=244830 RepID=UPI00289FD956|nr:hypothetical protein [Anaerospora hongkongensis]